MMQFFRLLFSEKPEVSMTRVMSLLCCISAIVIAIIGSSHSLVDYSGLTLLCSAFLSAAFGGKILQKRLETSGARSDIETTTRPNEISTPIEIKSTNISKVDLKVDDPD